MIKINCGVKFEEGVQVELSTVKDFYDYVNMMLKRSKTGELNYNVKAYIKSIDKYLILYDFYKTGSYEWAVLESKNSINAVPIAWKPLEEYEIEKKSDDKMCIKIGSVVQLNNGFIIQVTGIFGAIQKSPLELKMVLTGRTFDGITVDFEWNEIEKVLK